MIEGKVAQILNSRELIINIGTRSGVVIGMTFAVLAERPLDVVDPDTGETIGTLDREKVRVRAVEVHDSFSICRTYQHRLVPARGNTWGLSLTSLLGEYQPAHNEPVTFKAEDSSFPPPLSEDESYVKARDRVRELRARADEPEGS